MKLPKELKQQPWPEEYREKGRQSFRVTVRQPVVDHERWLAVTFRWNRAKPRFTIKEPVDFRVFCSKRQKIAITQMIGSSGGIEWNLAAAMGYAENERTCYPEISERDERMILDWLGGVKPTLNHGLPELGGWIDGVIEARKAAARKARGMFGDEDVVDCPTAIHPGMNQWLWAVPIAEDGVLVYKRGGTRGICTACNAPVRAQVKRFAQYDRIECPSCGSKVTCILQGGASYKADFVNDIATIQRGEDGKTVWIRQWHLCRDNTAEWRDPSAHLNEIVRYAIRGDQVAKWKREAKDYWRSHDRYSLSSWERMKDVTRIYDGEYCFFLPPDWQEIVRGTSLQYAPLAEYDADNARDHRGNMIRFIVDFPRYPGIEKLYKAGFKKLVEERENGPIGKNRYAVDWGKPEITKATRLPKHILRTKTPGQWSLSDVRRVSGWYMLVRSGRMRESDMEYAVKIPMEVKDVAVAVENSSARKVLQYLERQKEREREREQLRTPGYVLCYGTYRDYLHDLITLGEDLRNEQMLFPADLDRAHAGTIRRVKVHKNDKYRKSFEERCRKADWMRWERDGIVISPPKTCEDLIVEGNKLNHCVGTYIERVAKGECMIMLIRRVDEPDIPYYTLELRDGYVAQCRTKNNSSYEYDPLVRGFVGQWLAELSSGRLKKNRKK